jgi:hypothetical protein
MYFIRIINFTTNAVGGGGVCVVVLFFVCMLLNYSSCIIYIR